MKKLSLIAIAAVVAGAAGAVEPKAYFRADYGYTMDYVKRNGEKLYIQERVSGTGGFGVNYGGLVIEIPDLYALNKLYVGYALNLTNEFSLIPQATYQNGVVRDKGQRQDVYGAKLEAEYKVSPGFGLAATLGKSWNLSRTNTVDDFTAGTSARLGGKFYF